MLRPLSALFALLAALLAAGPLSAAIMLDRVVAVVNEEAITWGELYRNMEFNLSGQMKALDYSEKQKIFAENEAQFLEDMINHRVLLQEARKFGISVSNGDIDAAVRGVMEKFGMDEGRFMEALKAEGFTMQEYRKRLGEQLLIGRLLDVAVRSKIVVTNEEAMEFTGGEYDAFYRLRQILLRVPESGDMAAVEEKISAINAELEAGADFGMVAVEYSEGPFAQEGGALGLVQFSSMAKEFKDALSGVSAGGLSKPFRTSNGVHILKVEGVRNIKEFLAEKRFDEAYAVWLRELKEKSFIEIRL